MLGLIVLAILIYLTAFIISVNFKHNLGKCLFASAILLILLEYLLIALIKSALISIIIICFIVLIIFLTLIIRKKITFKFWKSYCKNVTHIYLACVVLCLVFSAVHGDYPSIINFDEIYFWIFMSNDIVNTDYFYITDNCRTYFHNDYPPFIALISSFPCVITQKTNIGDMCGSLWLFQFTFLLFIVPEDINKCMQKFINNSLKKIILLLCIGVLIFLLSFVVSYSALFGMSSFWIGINGDTLLGLAFGLGIYLSLKTKINNFDKFSLCLVLIFLLMIKQAGIIFYALILASFFICLAINRNIKNFLLCFLILVLAPLLFLLSWKLLFITSYAANNIDCVQFRLYLEYFIDFIISIFNPNKDEATIYVSSKFSEAYFDSISDGLPFVHLLGLSFFSLFAIGFILLFVLTVYLHKKNYFKIYLKILIIISLIIWVCSYFSVLFSYLYLFEENIMYEANCIPIYRYCGPFLTCLFVLVIYLLSSYLHSNKINWFISKLSFLNIVIVLVIVLSPATFSFPLNWASNFYHKYILAENQDSSIYMKLDKQKEESANLSKILPYKSKVLFDDNSNPNYIVHTALMNFYMDNFDVVDVHSSWKILDILERGNKEYILDYDYLLIANIPYEKKQQYKAIFDVEIEDNSLYKISVNNNNINLLKVSDFNFYLDNALNIIL